MHAYIDYEALFAATPSPCLVLTPELVIVEANQCYSDTTGRTRDELVGRYMFDAFPTEHDAGLRGSRSLETSVRRAAVTRQRDIQGPMKYDIPVAGRPGEFEERYWSTITSPVLGSDGEAMLFVVRTEDVTAFVTHRAKEDPERYQAMEAELFARAKELHEINEELRRAYARERRVALTLQQAMLPAIDLEQRDDVAVRYLPSVDSLHVCGDWYELIELDEKRLAVAVGDVVGHGLSAAGVMGQLRSALSTAVQSLAQPAPALQALGRYALSVEGALASTAVQAVIDKSEQKITYSCAGHLPPVLLQPDGTVEFLDQATDPPLGLRTPGEPRPQAEQRYASGAILVLYTDGLIERRGEDIDDGLRRLADSVGRHGGLDPESLADRLLADLGVAGGAADDTALVVVRL
ncbi:SpoIIE family protein phosphatase [Actinoallomurus rhizosphaericola]|uniref:SpoIIE family protein phosphatase n=1 Tax=Actinoallomurus rhizosphaericola TaxID=2952536 RepID=UPI0027E21AAC|nr:SpoIIE family protein phosphatase [Actinoallomurus rhizosphaericola]